MILAKQDGHAFSDPACEDLVMGLTIAGHSPARWKACGVWRETNARLPGALGISPMSEPMEFDVPDQHTLLLCTIRSGTVKSLSEHTGRDVVDILNSAHQAYIYDKKAEQLFREIWHQSGVNDFAANLHVDGLTLTLTSHLLRLLDNEQPGRKEATRAPPININELHEFIRSRMSDGLTVSAIASHFSMNKWSFSRALHEQIGVTPYRLVQEIRIEAAKGLLLDKQCSLSSIAVEVGFSDHAHFSKTFKSKTGMSPSEFRADNC